MKNIVLFEDMNYNNFGPLTKTRPVFELRNGIFSIRERFTKILNEYNFYFFTVNLSTAQWPRRELRE
jgi:hypothetical protein